MNETSYDTIFGRIALEQHLCTEDEFHRSVDRYKAHTQQDNPLSLDEVMIELGYITKTQAERVKDNIKESKVTANQIPGYRILGKLGAGAMAAVYKAKQLSLDRTVAIKVLPKRFSENPDYVRRFYQEGKAAASLNHNNIVQAYDVGETGGRHYFVMEYVEGKTIYEDLAEGKIFSEDRAIDITIQVAHALAHAHARGLIHRDVKPKNIMINSTGEVKLADMGLARQLSDVEAAQSEAGKAYGTPYYIAPEQIRGEVNIDGRADIYSLGATLYHMVTGRVPFEAPNPSDVMRKHLKENLIPPDHINTSLSAGISEVIEIMMAKDKDDRYASAEVLLIDLEAVRNGQPPLQARKKVNLDALEQLEKGQAVQFQPPEKVYKQETITRYRMIILVLTASAAALLLLLVYMALT
jgi:serine/threonine-protein kinase